MTKPMTDELERLTNARLLSSGDVARIFRVDPKTVARWAKAGKLEAIKTPGGHNRFRLADIQALLKAEKELG